MRDRLISLTRWVTSPDADEVPRHQAGGLAALRIIVGLMWLYNVAWKVPPDFGEDAGRGLYKFTSFAVEHPVLPPYSWLAEHVILPNIEVFGWLVLAAETTLAVLLLSGTYVRVAALIGIAQSGAIALSVAYAPEEWPWSYWLMIGAHLALLVAVSGRALSVDAVRSRVGSRALLLRVWGAVAVVAGLVSALQSFDEPLAASGFALGSSDPSISLGSYNLAGGVVLLVVGLGLLVAATGPRPVALAAAALAVASAVLLTAQRGFSDPWLGGTATSAAFFLTLAVVAVGATGRQADPETPSHTRRESRACMNASRRGVLFGSAGLLLLAACGSDDSGSSGSGASGGGEKPTLGITAIPDQDPELLNRLYPTVADRIAQATGLEVEYKPVTDYTAVVRAFEVGDVALAWMGGLTGVQARARLEGSEAFAQRDIDPDFHSLFIATEDSGLDEIFDASGLTQLAGKTFTFGSDTSTSGRLMPQYYMDQGGFDIADLQGEPGYSGSHDATIEAVASGSFEAGAVNEQVWQATLEDGEVDVSNVKVIWRTPGYADYHWLARPDLDETYGAGTQEKIADMLFALDVNDPADAKILELFGAESFIPAENSEYDRIEDVARQLGLLA